MSDDPTLALAAEEEPLFDLSLKKKKKKKVVAFNEDPLSLEGGDEQSATKDPAAAAEPGLSILKPVEEGA